MSYKTVVFDLDGTLLNTLGDLHAAVNFALTCNSMPNRTIEEVQRFVGNGIHVLICRAVPDNTPADIVEKCFQDFRSYYYEHLDILTKPYDGIIPCLTKLKALGITTAIASNKFDAGVKKLSDMFFGDLITLAVGESEEHGRKPDPKMIMSVFKELETDPSSAVYIGDSETDILTAQNADLPLIAVSWGFRNENTLINNGAKNIAHNTDELMEMIVK